MNSDGNIVESQAAESYVMAPDGFVALAENRKFQLGDVRIECRGQVMYYKPPASRSQIEAMIEQAECIEWPLYEDWGKTTKPVWLPIVLEGLVLTFRHESRGYHNGQSDLSLYAQEGDTVVGYINYSVFGDEIYIQYIHVNEDRRRGGIATAMAKNLQSQYPDKEINWGMSTEHGTAFLNALDREFQPDPTYAEIKKAYDDAKADHAALQAEFDAWIAADKGVLDQEMLMKGERMNDLDNLIYDLEDRLRDLKPGKWRVLGESEEMSPEDMTGFVQQALTLSNDWTERKLETVIGWTTDHHLALNDPTDRLLSSSINIRDLGLNDLFEPPIRDIWLKIHLASKNTDEDFNAAFGQQYEMLDVSLNISIQPNELDNFKAALKDGTVRVLKKALLKNEVFDLGKYEPVLRRYYNRVIAAFKAKTI